MLRTDSNHGCAQEKLLPHTNYHQTLALSEHMSSSWDWLDLLMRRWWMILYLTCKTSLGLTCFLLI